MIIGIVFLMPNQPSAAASVGCYNKLKLEKIRTAEASVPWLQEQEGPTVEGRWAVIRRGLVKITRQFVPFDFIQNNRRPH